MITRIAISGYRSLRDLRLPLGRLNIVTGANGSGKSSLYRALRLLADVAQGRVISALAMEGGLASLLWAGPETIGRAVRQGLHPVEGTRRRASVALRLGFGGLGYGYAIEIGYPQECKTSFKLDPVIKTESLWTGEALARANECAARRGPSVRLRDGEGEWHQALTTLAPYDSMMTHATDPRDGLDLLLLREEMRQWRFYDHLRTDAEAPARRPRIGTRTPVMAGDGGDLAAALQTIREIGDWRLMDETIADAFPGSAFAIEQNAGYFELAMSQHGLLRPLRAAELSDGTLRFLLLTAALLSPRPPLLLILNEPETSLHPDLLPALARLIALAAERSQMIVVTHASRLAALIAESAACNRIVLAKELGETAAGDLERPAWTWPAR